ncbi:NAD(P)H-dependent flavin oxidoreductase [Arthrobacter sp. NPDC090010]|uniref:NAD(P)H-dependent flavin oxidoreductase n=1 Tax=Arthrobacter sp. NPDC090010 TaxID=3363942 RepID=UPI00381677D2
MSGSVSPGFPMPRVVAAPMAGGTSSTAFVSASLDAGALAFMAGGYLSAESLGKQLLEVRNGAAVKEGAAFGVNLFVPEESAPERAAVERYAEALQPWAERLGVEVPLPRYDDDDDYPAKIRLLLEHPVPLLSFTFGLPDQETAEALHKRGTLLWATVTHRAELDAALGLGMDGVVLQHRNAGGHSGRFLPGPAPEAASVQDLVRELRPHCAVTLVAAGGIATPTEAAAALEAGADAVQLGTALLRSPESGARQLHKDALADARFTRTQTTRAFTGRAARALVNDFVREYDAQAPEAYPTVHHLTAPLRAAAARRGEADGLNLWAGTAWEQATTEAVGDIIARFRAATRSD